MSYRRLTSTEHETIGQMLASNESTPSISRLLDRAVSTVTREIARHASPCGPCSAFGADRQAAAHASSRHHQCKIPSTPEQEAEVVRLLHLRWSSEQVAHTLRSTYPDTPTMHVSQESSYTYIYMKAKKTLRQELLVNLRLHAERSEGMYDSVMGREEGGNMELKIAQVDTMCPLVLYYEPRWKQNLS